MILWLQVLETKESRHSLKTFGKIKFKSMKQGDGRKYSLKEAIAGSAVMELLKILSRYGCQCAILPCTFSPQCLGGALGRRDTS